MDFEKEFELFNAEIDSLDAPSTENKAEIPSRESDPAPTEKKKRKKGFDVAPPPLLIESARGVEIPFEAVGYAAKPVIQPENERMQIKKKKPNTDDDSYRATKAGKIPDPPAPLNLKPKLEDAGITERDYERLVAADQVLRAVSDKQQKTLQDVEIRAKSKKFMRFAAGQVWEDPTLAEFPDNDYRVFAGDLGNEVNDNTLAKLFVKYSSFAKAKVIRDKKTQKSKGFGFVSFLDPVDCANAIREVNGKYCGNRPIKLRRSKWGKRDFIPKADPKPRPKWVGKQKIALTSGAKPFAEQAAVSEESAEQEDDGHLAEFEGTGVEVDES